MPEIQRAEVGLDEAIVSLFGSGIATVAAAAASHDLPAGVVGSGRKVVERLSASEARAPMVALLDSFAKDIRGELHSQRLASKGFAQLATGLSAALESFPADDAMMRQGLLAGDPANGAGPPPPGILDAAELVADGILERAAVTGRLDGLGSSPDQARRLLLILFCRLLRSSEDVRTIGGHLGLFGPADITPAASGSASHARPSAGPAFPPAASAQRPVAAPAGSTPSSPAPPSRPLSAGPAIRHSAGSSRRRLDLPVEAEDIASRVAAENGVPLEALRAAANDLHRIGFRHERLASALRGSAGDLTALERMLSRSGNAEPAVLELRASALNAIREGQLEQADEILSGAEARDIGDVVRDSDRSPGRGLSASHTCAARARLLAFRGQYRMAGTTFERAANYLHESDRAGRGQRLLEKARVILRQARERGDEEALSDALGLLDTISGYFDAASDPVRYAEVNEVLADALLLVGQRSDDASSLERAAHIYLNILEMGEVQRTPVEWARLTHRAGQAFLRLGQLTRTATVLTSANDALKAATVSFERPANLRDWAMASLDLTDGLLSLGRIARSPDQFVQAEEICRDILSATTRERFPSIWIAAQRRLGDVLYDLAPYDRAPVRLSHSVAAYRAALDLLIEDRQPLDRAAVMASLGDALYALGVEDSTVETLLEGVEVQRQALEAYQERGAHKEAADLVERLKAKLDELQEG